MRSSEPPGRPLTRSVVRRHSRTRDVRKLSIRASLRPAVLRRLGTVVVASKTAALAAIALSVALLALATAAAAATPEGVLVIHSNQRATPAAIVIETTLGKVVPEALQRPIEIFSEYLDIEWASSETYAAAEAEFLRQKYSARDVRVIVAAATDALRFAIQYRDHMLPGVPLVHIAVAKDTLERISLPADVVGSSIDLDPQQTLEFALRLQPSAKHLVIVLGAADRDRIWEQRVRKAVGRMARHPEVEYLVGLPTDDVLRRLGALSKDTIVFTPGYFIDGARKVATPRQVLERIGPASAAPVYGPLDTFLGTGIVGGYTAPYEDQARQAGEIVVRLLNGTAPTEISASSIANVPVVDWRALRRWDLDERLLPADAVVRFREPTAWDRYWREISLGFAILLFQAGLIAALLVEARSRRRTATALEDSQKRIDLAAGAARLSMFVWDASPNAVSPTTQPRRRVSKAGETPIAFANVLETAYPADREHLGRALRDALSTGEELDVEYRVPLPDGGVRWVAARGRADKGNGHRMLGVAVDITERKLAELRTTEDRAALRHMTRVSMLGQLSASIAHQLNQPLAAILGNAEAARKMLTRERVDHVELRAICDDIVTEDNRAADVIRRLGALYKRGEIKMEPLDLNELIRETLDLLRAELMIRHVTPRIDLAPALALVDGERVQLQQVVLNLVLNAADAMRAIKVEDRSLAIRTEATGKDVRLSVVDNGSGIAEANLRNVFDAFWSTKPEGMGMGLALCRSIVAAHHGTITATNNVEGGATFCVSFPMRRA